MSATSGTAGTAGVAGAHHATASGDERHASWAELFFDLVAVAGISQLAHLMHAERISAADVGLYVLLYAAFWMCWAVYTVYGDTSGADTRILTLFAGMLALAVMVAAVPGIRDTHAQAFAAAYLAARLIASRSQRHNVVVADFPVTQLLGGIVPWFASLWVDGPIRYGLWAFGLAVDVVSLLVLNREEVVRSQQEHFEQDIRRRERKLHRAVEQGRTPHHHRRDGEPPPYTAPTLVVGRLQPAHLGERLGLFMIITLGEAVIQVTDAAGEDRWTVSLAGAAGGAFVLLICLWMLSLRYGYGGVPGLVEGLLPARITMALHCATTASVAATATGLGTAVLRSDGTVAHDTLRLLGTAVACYFAVAVAVGAKAWQASASEEERRPAARWVLTAALPATLGAAAFGWLGGPLGPVAVIWLLAACALWPTLQLRRGL